MVMSVNEIAKPNLDSVAVRPNLDDYTAMAASFKWEDLYSELDWLPGGGLNMAPYSTSGAEQWENSVRKWCSTVQK